MYYKIEIIMDSQCMTSAMREADNAMSAFEDAVSSGEIYLPYVGSEVTVVVTNVHDVYVKFQAGRPR